MSTADRPAGLPLGTPGTAAKLRDKAGQTYAILDEIEADIEARRLQAR